MKKIANQIKNYLSANDLNYYSGQVRIVKDLIIIDNLFYVSAKQIAEIATGLEFVHVDNSICKLK